MNEPQYKIRGSKRRELKKKLGELKRSVKYFWHYHQEDKNMCSLYGGGKEGYPMSDDLAQQKFDKANGEIKAIEERLSKPYC